MKYLKTLIIMLLGVVGLISCGSLKAPVIQQIEPITKYKYFYIMPTSEKTSSTGGVYGTTYGVYGGSHTATINPSDAIAGTLLKNGFIRLVELDPNLSNETLIINYGESGRRNLNLGYTIEVTIQFLSAKTNSVVCVCTAEGQGSTEADDVRIAINRALEPLFKK